MRILVVEDEPKIKTEVIDDTLASLGYECDWAKDQQEAIGFLVANDYDLMLTDLKIPSRPGGRPLAEYGKNLLRQAREMKGPDMAIILMTAQHQDCVDLMIELQEIGIDGSIAKPFPTTGRTLAFVIKEAEGKVLRRRVIAAGADKPRKLVPFAGGVLAFYPRYVTLCGEVIARKDQKGYAWAILQLLREQNDRGRYVRLDGSRLAAKLDRDLAPNTLSQSIKALRDRIAEVFRERLDLDCGPMDVVANGGKGYHLREWIVVEVHDEVEGVVSKAPGPGKVDTGGNGDERFSERQRWVLAQLAGGRQLTRRDVEKQFGVGDRTAKRELNGLVAAGMIEYDRSESPGGYRLRT